MTQEARNSWSGMGHNSGGEADGRRNSDEFRSGNLAGLERNGSQFRNRLTMERDRKVSTVLAAALVLVAAGAMPVVAQTPVDIGGSLQLFTDLSLVQTLTHATLELHEPVTRQDGAGSVGARYSGGELLTKPIVFSGRQRYWYYVHAANACDVAWSDYADDPPRIAFVQRARLPAHLAQG